MSSEEQVNLTISPLFNANLYGVKLPGAEKVNPDLRADILAWREEDREGRGGSMRGAGWQSVNGLDRPAFQRLLPTLTSAAVAVARLYRRHPGTHARLTEMWANVLEAGGHHQPHRHLADLSGVYYVDCPEGSPPTTFLNPLVAGPHPRQEVHAEAGLAVLFPGFLFHYVEPHRAETPRVSVSFNVNLEHNGGNDE